MGDGVLAGHENAWCSGQGPHILGDRSPGGLAMGSFCIPRRLPGYAEEGNSRGYKGQSGNGEGGDVPERILSPLQPPSITGWAHTQSQLQRHCGLGMHPRGARGQSPKSLLQIWAPFCPGLLSPHQTARLSVRGPCQPCGCPPDGVWSACHLVSREDTTPSSAGSCRPQFLRPGSLSD